MSKPLLQRNTRTLLIWLPVVLLISSGFFYIMLNKHARHAQEKLLLLKQQNTWNAFVSSSGALAKRITGEYNISETETIISANLGEPRDTVIYYPDKKKALPFQVLTGRFQWNGRTYYVSTYVSSTEIKHLIIKVFATEAVILLLLLIAIIVLNRKSSVRLWRPFFSTINAAEDFDLTGSNRLQLPEETGTTEFDRLNAMLTGLTSRVNTAYLNQKQFVENASHEIQTPLAVIHAKLELLINQPDITEKEALLLSDITNATNRLSEMNKTLLLLAKIENNQFPDMGLVNISEVAREVLEDCRDYTDDCPDIVSSIENDIMVTANRSLIEILVSNLVNNAIVHNNSDKKIKVSICGRRLIIENTGDAPEIPPAELFERFKKASHNRRTTGLGLSLVKQIGQLYRYKIDYVYKNGWHIMDVTF